MAERPRTAPPQPAPEAAPVAAEPRHAFADSRRLTGPNRWFGSPAATLTPLGPAALDPQAHADWAARVQRLATALGWPAPPPRVHVSGGEATLVCAAPADALFTATELNEWAWELAGGAAQAGFDRAQDLGDEAAALAVLAARAAAESHAGIRALREAAAAHRLPLLLDDEALSIGLGAGSRCWPLDALPTPAAVPWPALVAAAPVPVALVTGSNGKTTTVRLLAAMAAAAGLCPGHCCTEGVVVGGQTLHTGDYAGPAGARTVLRHPQVQAAILETARGGILRRGLAVQRAEVAVVTRIAPDHLGEYGVHSAQDLAETKLALAHAVRAGGGVLVLNADDALLMATAQRLPHAAAVRQALFAAEHRHPALMALRASGGSTCGAQDGRLLMAHQGAVHDLGAVAALPLTLGGAAPYNQANASAAALAAASLGWPLAAVAATLRSFGSQPQHNPGRLERWSWRGATVLIDYAHNPDGLAQLLAVARALAPRRLGLLLGQAGNRSDEAIAELARTAAASQPDRVHIKELPGMLRGRAPGAVPALLEQALLGAGLPRARLRHIADETGAAQALLAWAEPGDVVVLPLHEARQGVGSLALIAPKDAPGGDA